MILILLYLFIYCTIYDKLKMYVNLNNSYIKYSEKENDVCALNNENLVRCRP